MSLSLPNDLTLQDLLAAREGLLKAIENIEQKIGLNTYFVLKNTNNAPTIFRASSKLELKNYLVETLDWKTDLIIFSIQEYLGLENLDSNSPKIPKDVND